LVGTQIADIPGQVRSTLVTGGLQTWELQYFGRLPVWLLMSHARNLAGSQVGLERFWASRVPYSSSIDPHLTTGRLLPHSCIFSEL